MDSRLLIDAIVHQTTVLIYADGEGHLAARAPFESLNLDIMWVDAGRCGG